MLLTLADALKEIDVLSNAVVVAGQGGLGRRLRGVHVVDHPDITPWLREGDLLLTTAYGLKDNPQLQLELIPSLAEKSVCGMVVAVGRYFQRFPPETIALANRLEFPIIALRWEVPFVEITEAIHKQILTQQYALLEKSFHIHRVLTQLVVEGRGLNDLAESLAGLLGRPVTIENPSLRLMAAAFAGPVDEIRKRTVEEGGTPKELVSHLTAQGVFECLRRNPKPRRVPAAPEMGMTLERILAPIMVGTHLYGYVWIIATECPLAELDFQAIESAAVVAALIISRQQAIHEAEQRLKSNILDSLLDPDPYHAIQNLTQTLRRLGLHLGYQLIVIESLQPNRPNTVFVCNLVESRLKTMGLRATVVERGERLIVLLATADKNKGLEAARSLAAESTRQSVPLAIGLSDASEQATQGRQRYQEALEALRVGKALSRGESGVWSFEELGFLHWLRAVPPDIQATSRYHRIISEIVEHDQQNKTELLRTLEAYLDSFGNAQQATRQLFIHRNTLRQRLCKIEDSWSLSLEDPNIMLNLLLAIKDWRLNQTE